MSPAAPRRRRLALASALLAVVLALPWAARAQRPPSLSIIAPPALEPAAAALGRLDTQKLVTAMRLVGLDDPGPPITVLLAAEDSALARQTPDWVAGFADSRAGRIVLFPARTPAYPYDSMSALLNHEVTHVLVGRAAPGADIPRWFHEGLAMAAERTWSLRDRSELLWAVAGGRRSLEALDADFRGSAASAARAYGVAGAFVRDLLHRHGARFPARLLSRMAAGASFDDAFGDATATSLAAAERAFWRETWWYQLVPFLTSSLVLWMAIVALAIAARRTRAARRRLLHERWAAEDRRQAAAAVESPVDGSAGPA